METIYFVVVLLVLILSICIDTFAYKISQVRTQRVSNEYRFRFINFLEHKRCFVRYPKRRYKMSVESTINDDNDSAMLLLGNSGNTLQITWERDVAKDILQRANDAKRAQHSAGGDTIPTPYMVAIAGIPGSGKSSSAEIITRIINEISAKSSHSSSANPICVCIPADGYHYNVTTLQELERRTNDTTLIYRRGAPDTFDVTALIQDLERIRYPHHAPDESTNVPPQVALPGFDHAVGDPTIHQHVYDRRQHSILIMEGLYLLYDQHQWDRIKDYFDYSIYIQTHSIDICMQRVKERNVVIPGYTVEEIHRRVDIVDRNNAILIDQASPSRAHHVITSKSSAVESTNPSSS